MNKYDDANREDTAKLLDLLTIKYGFDGFYHYTDYSNLRKIFGARTLLARNRIGADFYDSADPTVLSQAPDWIHDQVRLFYFPKPPFLYNNEGIKPKEKLPFFEEPLVLGAHMPRPVAFRFNKDIAYINGIKYCDASASYLLAPNAEHITKIEKQAKNAIKFDWCFIASREPYGKNRDACGKNISNPTITNLRNAEILIPNQLPLSYLDQIIFRSEADRKQAIIEFGDSKLYHVRFGVFHNKRSYLLDYELAWKERADHIHIDLVLFPGERLEKYVHVMKLYSTNGLRREEAFILHNRNESVDLYNCEDITRIEYYMDDTLCAVWEANR